jgi:2-amino-4-hydroxy-6-hydroxymethyldihydropteridine diphosphokinase
MKYFLGMGSNMGDRKKNLKNAVDLLIEAGISILSASSVYETEPVGIATDVWFYNQVIAVETQLIPDELLCVIKRIEEKFGRDHREHLHSRSIDIDILLFEEQVVNTRTLEIPHPRMAERRFVLVPLAEIAPHVRHPVLNEKITELLDKSKDRSRVRKL